LSLSGRHEDVGPGDLLASPDLLVMTGIDILDQIFSDYEFSFSFWLWCSHIVSLD